MTNPLVLVPAVSRNADLVTGDGDTLSVSSQPLPVPDASAVTYSPAAPFIWIPQPPPADVAPALDALAAAEFQFNVRIDGFGAAGPASPLVIGPLGTPPFAVQQRSGAYQVCWIVNFTTSAPTIVDVQLLRNGVTPLGGVPQRVPTVAFGGANVGSANVAFVDEVAPAFYPLTYSLQLTAETGGVTVSVVDATAQASEF